jgi:hypothetical protein
MGVLRPVPYRRASPGRWAAQTDLDPSLRVSPGPGHRRATHTQRRGAPRGRPSKAFSGSEAASRWLRLVWGRGACRGTRGEARPGRASPGSAPGRRQGQRAAAGPAGCRAALTQAGLVGGLGGVALAGSRSRRELEGPGPRAPALYSESRLRPSPPRQVPRATGPRAALRERGAAPPTAPWSGSPRAPRRTGGARSAPPHAVGRPAAAPDRARAGDGDGDSDETSETRRRPRADGLRGAAAGLLASLRRAAAGGGAGGGGGGAPSHATPIHRPPSAARVRPQRRAHARLPARATAPASSRTWPGAARGSAARPLARLLPAPR